MLSKKQIQLIQIAKRKLALTDEDYRAILIRFGQVDSSTKLDYLGFESVMKHFAHLGFRSTWNKQTFGNRRNMATPNQINLIRELWLAFTGEEQDEKDAGLNAWLSKYHKVSALRMISEGKVKKVIPALKIMAKRKHTK